MLYVYIVFLVNRKDICITQCTTKSLRYEECEAVEMMVKNVYLWSNFPSMRLSKYQYTVIVTLFLINEEIEKLKHIVTKIGKLNSHGIC